MEERVVNLQPIHNNPELLSQLDDLMERQLPRSYPFQTWLRLKHKFYLLSPSDHPYFVYCPDGNLENGIVMFAEVDQVIFNVNILLFNNNLKPMETALLRTELIDWRKVKSCGVPNGRVVWFYLILKKLGYTMARNTPINAYILPPEAPNDVVRVPDHLYCLPLREADMQIMRLICQGRFVASESIIRDCLRFNQSIGIFTRSDEAMICWILQYDYGQCLINVAERVPADQRLQLITFAIASISNLIASSGQYPMCFIESANRFLIRVTEEQHFKYICSYNWIDIMKAPIENVPVANVTNENVPIENERSVSR